MPPLSEKSGGMAAALHIEHLDTVDFHRLHGAGERAFGIARKPSGGAPPVIFSTVDDAVMNRVFVDVLEARQVGALIVIRVSQNWNQTFRPARLSTRLISRAVAEWKSPMRRVNVVASSATPMKW